MNTVQDFFDHYRLEEFYNWQHTRTSAPIRPFEKSIHKKFSFGIIPGYRNYDLFYERYLSAVLVIKEEKIIQNGTKVLDIGTGDGFFKFFFDATFDEKIQWQGIEVWKERAEFCRHIGYEISETNLENGVLPFDDESFDIVLASHVIEHIPNPHQMVREMGRVLKKGGVFLIATPTKPPLIAELDSLYHKISSRKTGETQQAFTHWQLQRLTLRAFNQKKDSIVDKRGFRILSGRKKLPFENWKWFYKASVFLGKRFMILVPEINIIIKKSKLKTDE
ncbi:MAG: class I SAM-dependent methyltransferase [Bacteroidetes bacterium]|jgi:ubiquinone/menaquinone biosynthesis C-methylase UbiE|nr:class I SAM-dependent methyltransferase [Bacteroidota bacterium]MBT4398267.1 class I SAM-dependent methyltransferase [Bacteroidota bacterium]MBT4409052.1 class I SAM-dependent methyltransferase [Bacteroidota bacterium]MBT5425535.1 class I SAM-dependent methyltransferase [Bacteroidota bacterium]MBT7463831.1 class I SAM-dependent methyltransferase [Bacteroidota bacterium]